VGDPMQAVRHIMATHPPVRALIEAIASSSAYLWELARADPARLVALLKTDPDERLASLRAAAEDIPADATDVKAMRLLRFMKAEAALLIALADIGGLWDVMRVTAALTEVADTAVTAALRHVLRQAARAGRLALP
jgi:[glutamine synthetase] adenylyltransferase / [glutamine synthetase]-adenylyl-L-tyrosine phosphorylase